MFYLHRRIQANDGGGQRVEIFSTAEKFGEYLQHGLGGDRNVIVAIGMINNPGELPPELHQIWTKTHALVDEGILHFFTHTMLNGNKVDVFAPHSGATLAAGKDVGWWWMPTGAIPQQRHGPYKTKDEAYIQAAIANR